MPPVYTEQALREGQIDVGALGQRVPGQRPRARRPARAVHRHVPVRRVHATARYVFRDDFIAKNPDAVEDFVQGVGTRHPWTQDQPARGGDRPVRGDHRGPRPRGEHRAWCSTGRAPAWPVRVASSSRRRSRSGSTGWSARARSRRGRSTPRTSTPTSTTRTRTRDGHLMTAALELVDVRKDFVVRNAGRQRAVHRPAGPRPGRPGRAVPGRRRPQRLRQVDAARPARGPHDADRRAGSCSTAQPVTGPGDWTAASCSSSTRCCRGARPARTSSSGWRPTASRAGSGPGWPTSTSTWSA